MSLALKIVLLIASIILTVSILLQSSNSAGLSGSIGGGAEQLFGKEVDALGKLVALAHGWELRVVGVVRSLESYGIFVELAPNLAGLAEWKEGVLPGEAASVYIKSILPEKRKVKLVLVDSFPAEKGQIPTRYFITRGNVRDFAY